MILALTDAQLFAAAIVLGVLAIALLADALDAWRLRRKAERRRAEFAADHRGRTPLAGSNETQTPISPPLGRSRQAFTQPTNKRGRRR